MNETDNKIFLEGESPTLSYWRVYSTLDALGVLPPNILL